MQPSQKPSTSGSNHNNKLRKKSKKRKREYRSPASLQQQPSRVVEAGRCVNVSDRYEKLGGRVGQGTYGVVYKAKDLRTGKLVALKRCLPHHQDSDGFPVTTLREIQSLRACEHCNIVALESVAVSKEDVFLVFEYCDHDLGNLIDDHYQNYGNSPFSVAATKTLFRQLLSALEHMHERNLIHRDIKASNLLYTNAGLLKLADFGLSRSYSSFASMALMTPKVASLWYRPPELLLGSPSYTQAIDLWAAGCILAELLQGCPLLDGKTEVDQIQKIFRCMGAPTIKDWPELQDLPLIRDSTIELPDATAATWSSRTLLNTEAVAKLRDAGFQLLTGLLQYNPSKRWSAQQALESNFFGSEKPKPVPVQQMPYFPSKH